MKHYRQVCNRHLVMGRREFNRGDVIRTVSMSEREAEALNAGSDSGFIFELAEEQPKKESYKTIETPMAAKFSEAAKKRPVTRKIKKEIAKDKLTGE